MIDEKPDYISWSKWIKYRMWCLLHPNVYFWDYVVSMLLISVFSVVLAVVFGAMIGVR